MQYHSTRDCSCITDSCGAILAGIAPDGGLYLPRQLPAIDWQECVGLDVLDMAERIMAAFFPEIPEMGRLVKQAYTGKFRAQGLTPLVPVGDMWVLELFHGPTSAFKDVALSMLPQLMTAAREEKGAREEIMILTATSGDTGKAALEGFKDVPGVRICVFYPDGGVSEIQRLQMVSQQGRNVTVCGVRGNFDDAQTGVKEIFAACRDKELPFRLSSANSINIGRLVPQIVYYFKAYGDLLKSGAIRMGDQVDFSVPTGNFGDILAGYLAGRMGLPVGRLVCASNANRVLTDLLQTGVYNRKRPLLKTTSPSMDILVSSNLERLLYLESEDPALVKELMEKLNREGSYTLPEDLLNRLQEQFWADSSDDAGTAETLRAVWEKWGYLCDPHTAAGWAAAEKYRAEQNSKNPMVVLSTASPYKFTAAALDALGQPVQGDAFAQMEALHTLCGVEVPANLSGLKNAEERHTGVIDKDRMLPFVLGL